jgi:hypothetical protein
MMEGGKLEGGGKCKKRTVAPYTEERQVKQPTSSSTFPSSPETHLVPLFSSLARRMTTNVSRAMTPPSPGHGKAAKAAHAIKAMKELLMGADIEDCVALVDENLFLKKENTTLEEDLESRDRRIASLQHSVDEAKEQSGIADAQLKKLRNELGILSDKLKEAQEELKKNHKAMANKEAGLAKAVKTLEADLDAERKKYQDLKSFSVELKPMAKHQKEM